MPSFTDRLQHAWDAFMNKDPTLDKRNYGVSSFTRPNRPKLSYSSERTIVTSVYNRIAIDCSMIDIRHCKVDDNRDFLEEIDSSLNECFITEANFDQTSRAFLHDAVLSMLDDGCVAIVPTVTNLTPSQIAKGAAFKIGEMRTAKITEWFPEHVKVNIYNPQKGRKVDMILPKRMVSIIENPFYAVMNENNSVAKRLMRKLALLDTVDEMNSSGKLDLIIQLPYVIRNDARRRQAEERRKDIEVQLTEGKYGIAYTDGTEKVTQLNRPVENQLLAQIDSLTKTLYSQLSITESIMNGTANENEMNNYLHGCIEVIVTAIVDEMRRKFLSKTARSQGQDIKFFRDPFKILTVTQLANTADVFSRNEIMSSNEFRQKLCLKPSDNPRADELRNSNMPQNDMYYDEGYPPEEELPADETAGDTTNLGDIPISNI